MNNPISSKIKKGGVIPGFTLSNANGKIISSDIFLRKNNLIILFFGNSLGGDCRNYLEMLNGIYESLKDHEAEVLVVTSEGIDVLARLSKEKKIKFNLFSDSRKEVFDRFITGANNHDGSFALFITDKFHSLYKAYVGRNLNELPNKDELLASVEFLEKQYPECGVSTWPEDLE